MTHSELTVDDMAEADAANSLTLDAFEHYIKHHTVVLTKLQHAREATSQSLQEITQICERYKLDRDATGFAEIQKYETMWDSIIDLFRRAGVSETELHKIEMVLTGIPRAIRDYYETLIQQDQILQSLIAELKSEKYQKAFQAVQAAQSVANPMSGEYPEDYDEVVAQAMSDIDVQVFTNLPRRKMPSKTTH